MKIGIASDHRGFKLKQKLIKYLEKNYKIIDYGTFNEEKTDYTKYASILGNAINSNEVSIGIAICGTGIGMSIYLNKMKNIMCAKVSTKKEAYYSKLHNNANVIAISGNTSFIKTKTIINTFLTTNYIKNDSYQKRINDIKELEND